jgi:hypothetical protein
MNDLSNLEVQIQETRQAIAMHQQAIAVSPSPSLSASLQSLQKRLERLEGVGLSAANETSALLLHGREAE